MGTVTPVTGTATTAMGIAVMATGTATTAMGIAVMATGTATTAMGIAVMATAATTAHRTTTTTAGRYYAYPSYPRRSYYSRQRECYDAWYYDPYFYDRCCRRYDGRYRSSSYDQTTPRVRQAQVLSGLCREAAAGLR